MNMLFLKKRNLRSAPYSRAKIPPLNQQRRAPYQFRTTKEKTGSTAQDGCVSNEPLTRIFIGREAKKYPRKIDQRKTPGMRRGFFFTPLPEGRGRVARG